MYIWQHTKNCVILCTEHNQPHFYVCYFDLQNPPNILKLKASRKMSICYDFYPCLTWEIRFQRLGIFSCWPFLFKIKSDMECSVWSSFWVSYNSCISKENYSFHATGRAERAWFPEWNFFVNRIFWIEKVKLVLWLTWQDVWCGNMDKTKKFWEQ